MIASESKRSVRYQRDCQTHRSKINLQRHCQKKKTNLHIIVHKTQHRKLKTTQHEPHQKLGVNLGAAPNLPPLHVGNRTALNIEKPNRIVGYKRPEKGKQFNSENLGPNL